MVRSNAIIASNRSLTSTQVANFDYKVRKAGIIEHSTGPLGGHEILRRTVVHFNARKPFDRAELRLHEEFANFGAVNSKQYVGRLEVYQTIGIVVEQDIRSFGLLTAVNQILLMKILHAQQDLFRDLADISRVSWLIPHGHYMSVREHDWKHETEMQAIRSFM